MITAALLMLTASSSSANPLGSGSDLLAACTSVEREMHGLCTAYILGVGDGADMQRAMADVFGGKPYCVYQMRGDVTAAQMRAIVVSYLNEHPENRAQPTSRLIISAFAQAFPCPDEPANHGALPR